MLWGKCVSKISYQVFNVCMNANTHILSYAKKLRKYYLCTFRKFFLKNLLYFKKN